MSKLPSPSEAKPKLSEAELEAARSALADAIRKSEGKAFTCFEKDLPKGAREILLEELFAAGWDYSFHKDAVSYYQIFPRRRSLVEEYMAK